MLYEAFLQRVTEFTNQLSFPMNEARIVSEASPMLVKNDPKPVLVLGAMLLLGLVGGLALAFGREYFDKSFRSSEQVEKELGAKMSRCFADNRTRARSFTEEASRRRE